MTLSPSKGKKKILKQETKRNLGRRSAGRWKTNRIIVRSSEQKILLFTIRSQPKRSFSPDIARRPERKKKSATWKKPARYCRYRNADDVAAAKRDTRGPQGAEARKCAFNDTTIPAFKEGAKAEISEKLPGV